MVTRTTMTGLFILAMLFFFMPWFEDCGGGGEVSGIDLVVGRDEVDANPYAVATLVLAAIGIALFFVKGVKEHLLRAMIGVLGVPLLLAVPSWGGLGEKKISDYGWLLTLLAFLIVAVLNAVAFALAVARLRRGMRKPWKPWLAALLNVVPLPIGLGYVYLGRPGRLVMTLIGRSIAGIAGIWLGDLHAEDVIIAAPIVLALGLTSWDAWHVALDHNANLFARHQAIGVTDQRLGLDTKSAQ